MLPGACRDARLSSEGQRARAPFPLVARIETPFPAFLGPHLLSSEDEGDPNLLTVQLRS
jgi:hypothetical protein